MYISIYKYEQLYNLGFFSEKNYVFYIVWSY